MAKESRWCFDLGFRHSEEKITKEQSKIAAVAELILPLRKKILTFVLNVVVVSTNVGRKQVDSERAARWRFLKLA